MTVFAVPAQAASSSSESLLGTKDPAKGTPVKIGLVTDGKGSATDNSIETPVTEAAVKWINQYRGGIGGHPIDLDICVTGGDPSEERRLCEPDDPGRRGGGGVGCEPVHPEHLDADPRGRHPAVRRHSSGNPDVLADPDSTFIMQAGPSAIQNLIIGAAKKAKAKDVSAVVIDVPPATQIFEDKAPYQKAGLKLEMTPVALGTADMTPQMQKIVSDNPKGGGVRGRQRHVLHRGVQRAPHPVVTGAAGGIGGALVRALVAAGADTVVAVDLDADGIVAGDHVVARRLDVGDEAATVALVEEITAEHGPIDLWFANAGVAGGGGYDASDDPWALQWRVNVMSHVYAARALLPGWIARGEGHLVTTASMAGILTSLGDGVYAATKHAAVGFAEWLAITHGDDGVKVSCICPGAVDTAMLRGGAGGDAARATAVIGGGEVLAAGRGRSPGGGGGDGGSLPDPHPPRDADVHRTQGRRSRPLDRRHDPPVGSGPAAAGRLSGISSPGRCGSPGTPDRHGTRATRRGRAPAPGAPAP